MNRCDRLEAVTVCIGYADFLAETVKWNRSHFDRWIVVTSPQDTDTREVCRQNHLQCLVSNDAKRGGVFNKGRLVERGLQHLSADAWILHLDADIVLPATFRHEVERAHLNDDDVHGFDRFDVPGYERWKRLVASGWPHKPSYSHPHNVLIPAGFSLAARWSGPDGYVPIGFAQLWHRNAGGEEWRGTRTKQYPQSHGNACRADVQFALQWDRRDRILVPEVIVAHLVSPDAKTGINWAGRRSAPFGPHVLHAPNGDCS